MRLRMGIAVSRPPLASLPDRSPYVRRGELLASAPRDTVPLARRHSSWPVLGLLFDRRVRARVAEAARGSASALVFFEGPEQLLAHLGRSRASVVIVDSTDSSKQPTLPTIEAIRSGYPSVPVIAYVRPGGTATRHILAMGELGVHELIFEGVDDTGIALRTALQSAVRQCAAVRVVDALRPHLTSDVLPFVRYCLDRVSRDPSVTDAADYLGVHRKTLVYRLRRSGLPPPRAVIGWCKLFLAAQLLEDPRRSVASVALELDFASTSALRGMLRRYTGLRPQELRSRGGLEAALALFLDGVRPTTGAP